MIPEEMERLMQFILEHQAQFSVDMGKAKERMARIEGIQENTARQIQHMGDALVALTEAHERTREEMAESHERTQESLRELTESTQVALKELAASQAHSDRRLDALMDIVRGGRDTGQT
jgi:hypothetical protein